MATAWKDVIQSPGYMSLSQEDKEAAQKQYFNEVVAPQATTENLDQVKNEFFNAYPALPEEGGIVDTFIEPAISIGASAIGQIGSGLGGIYELIKTGDLDKAANAVKDMQEGISERFAPETEAGKEGLENVSQAASAIEENIIRPAMGGTAGLVDVALNPISNIQQGFAPAIQEVEAIKEQGLAKAVGVETLEKTGSPFLATILSTAVEAGPDIAGGLFAKAKATSFNIPNFKKERGPTPSQEKIIQDIKAGVPDEALAKKMLDGSGKVVDDIKAVETIKQGFDSGVVSAIKASSDIDKRRMLQMVEKVEKGKKFATYAAENRPADVVGNSLLSQVLYTKKQNIDAGRQLSRIAKGLKGEDVDINTSIDSFIKDAQGMGVTFDDKLTPNFEGSTIETIAPAKKLINDILLKIRRNPTPDAFEAHQFKKFIDENVNFVKSAKGLSGKTEQISKKLRAGINNTLAEDFVKYGEANKRYSETINVLDAIQDASGRTVNLYGANADKALGTTLRRLMNNTQSRVNLMDSIKELDKVNHKYGGSFDDSIITQVLFADELDILFDTAGRTSFAGETKKGTKKALEAISGEGGIFRTGIDFVADASEKLRGINEKNAIKAIKELLRDKK